MQSHSLSSTSQSQPAGATSGVSSCQDRKHTHTFCPLQLVASVCNWGPGIAGCTDFSRNCKGKLKEEPQEAEQVLCDFWRSLKWKDLHGAGGAWNHFHLQRELL
jgi:hypothetical protein